jgi:hypothetical protein
MNLDRFSPKSKNDVLAKSPILSSRTLRRVTLSETKGLDFRLRINSVKDLQLFDLVRFFAEFTLSEAEGLRMTSL